MKRLFHMMWLTPCVWTYIIFLRSTFEDGITKDAWIFCGIVHYVLLLALSKIARRFSHALLALGIMIVFWPLALVFIFVMGSTITNRAMSIGRWHNHGEDYGVDY